MEEYKPNPSKRLYLKCLTVFFFVFLSSNVFSSNWIYTVRQGDTLWDLCATYTNVVNCWLTIGQYNGVEYPKVMAPGTRIKFPVRWLKNPPTTAKIVYVRGDVEKIFESGESGSATNGMELVIGDSVRTGESSTTTILFADKTVLILEENSYLTMDLLSLARDKTMVDSRVNLLRGSASARVPKPDNIDYTKPDRSNKNTRTRKPSIQRRFEIETPSAVAAVRGTKFRVSARENGAEMASEVYSGEIKVSQEINHKNSEKYLPKEYGIIAEQNKKIGDPIELLEAPIVISKNFTQYETLDVSWQSLNGANLYVLSLFASEAPDNLLKKSETDNTNYTFEGLPVGCYNLGVQGIDRFGLQGLVSKKQFCVTVMPSAPIAKIEHDKNYNGSVLSWTSVPVVEEYQVEFSNTESFLTVEKFVPAYEQNYPVSMIEKRDYDYVRVKSKLGYSVFGKPSEAIPTKQ